MAIYKRFRSLEIRWREGKPISFLYGQMQIRRLQVHEAEIGSRLVKQFNGRTVSLQHMRRYLGNTSNYVLVAEAEGELLGFLTGHRLHSFSNEADALFIYEIEVAEPYRRQGIGKALMGHIEIIARSLGCFEMYVFTNYSNRAARALYTATGGQVEVGDELMFVYRLR